MTGARARLAAAWAAALLAACAGTPAPAPDAAPPPATATVAPAPRPADGVAAFERRQLEAATRALRREHLAEAALAWETLAVLRPGHAPYREQLAALRARIGTMVSARLQAAAAAQRRGDLDAAADAYLEALALDPTQAQAADGLRAVERERSRQRATTRFARAPTARRANGVAAARVPLPAAAGASNQIEHAALLAGAGELDAAIAVLTSEQAARPADPAVRGALAELHYRRAEHLQPRDRAAALEALAACLALEPRHAAARQLQQRLRGVRPGGLR